MMQDATAPRDIEPLAAADVEAQARAICVERGLDPDAVSVEVGYERARWRDYWFEAARVLKHYSRGLAL